MEIDKIASAAAAGRNLAGVTQTSGAQNSEIDELQRLADSIRKMENDIRITARVQSMSGAGLQTKLRQYDELLGKVNQQIRDLQDQSCQKDDGKTIGVSLLQYNTDATQLTLRSTGTSTGAAVTSQRNGMLSKVEADAEARRAEQAAKEAKQEEEIQPASKGLFDVRI